MISPNEICIIQVYNFILILLISFSGLLISRLHHDRAVDIHPSYHDRSFYASRSRFMQNVCSFNDHSREVKTKNRCINKKFINYYTLFNVFLKLLFLKQGIRFFLNILSGTFFCTTILSHL